MTQPPLTNYIRTYRRRRGLSQDEVAFLLGVGLATGVSRHESGDRVPLLETALAYEVILQIPVSVLFAGHYRTVESIVRQRAKTLAAEIDQLPVDPARDQKLAHLGRVTAGPAYGGS